MTGRKTREGRHVQSGPSTWSADPPRCVVPESGQRDPPPRHAGAVPRPLAGGPNLKLSAAWHEVVVTDCRQTATTRWGQRSGASVMSDVQQSDHVHELRARGFAPKQIARALGLPHADVIAVLNRTAAENSGAAGESQIRCWVSRGWARELRVNGHDEWPGLDDDSEAPGGLVCVLVARRHRHDKVSVCGYLIDVHCLGVKNALGPRLMDEVDLVAFRRWFFAAYGADPVVAPLDLHNSWSSVPSTTPGVSASSRTPTTPTSSDTSGTPAATVTSSSVEMACRSSFRGPTTTRVGSCRRWMRPWDRRTTDSWSQLRCLRWAPEVFSPPSAIPGGTPVHAEGPLGGSRIRAHAAEVAGLSPKRVRRTRSNPAPSTEVWMLYPPRGGFTVHVEVREEACISANQPARWSPP